jgi:hypothetical protein
MKKTRVARIFSRSVIIVFCTLFFISSCTNTNTFSPLPTVITQTLLTETPTITPTLGPTVTYLADMSPADVQIPIRIGKYGYAVGYYPLTEDQATYGAPLIAHGVEYKKGLFAHAPSTLIYDLNEKYNEFKTTILISDKATGHAEQGARFRVDLDGETAYLSPEMFNSDEPISLDLDVTGVKRMRLEVYAGLDNLYWGDDNYGDWSIWGDPLLIAKPATANLSTNEQIITTPVLLTPAKNGDPIAEFYISPTGKDTNPGTITAPFATIMHARDVIRTINKNMQGPINVFLRGGLYEESETIVFSESDSGSNGFSIDYQAFPGETPIISGGKEIKGNWQVVSDKPYFVMKVPQNIEPFRNLYVNGKRATRAYMEAPIIGVGWSKGDWSDCDGIVVSSSSLPITFAKPEDLELHWNLDWVDARARVETVTTNNEKQTIITMKEPYFLWQISNGHSDNKWRPRWDAPFYVENALELLDQPGEWYYDKSTYELYYYPKEDENLDDLQITIPQIETLIKIEGSTINQTVKNISFSGITFSYNSWMQASIYGFRGELDEFMDGLSGEVGFATAVMELNNTKNIQIIKNRFINSGSSAINVINNNSEIAITGNLIQNTSKNAIVIGWPTEFLSEEIKSLLDPQSNSDITISDNLLNQIGVEYWGSPGIEYFYGNNIQITHNYLKNVANSGISLNGFQNGFIKANPLERIINISNNRIEDTSAKGEYPKPYDFATTVLGGDAGGVYINSTEPGTTIENNYIKNVIHNYSCIYLDFAPVGMNIFHNICDTAPSWIYFHLGDENGHQTKDIVADDNYTNVPALFEGTSYVHYDEANPYINKTNNIQITNTHYFPDSGWPKAALEIIDQAGLEPDYKYLENNLFP